MKEYIRNNRFFLLYIGIAVACLVSTYYEQCKIDECRDFVMKNGGFNTKVIACVITRGRQYCRYKYECNGSQYIGGVSTSSLKKGDSIFVFINPLKPQCSILRNDYLISKNKK